MYYIPSQLNSSDAYSDLVLRRFDMVFVGVFFLCVVAAVVGVVWYRAHVRVVPTVLTVKVVRYEPQTDTKTTVASHDDRPAADDDQTAAVNDGSGTWGQLIRLDEVLRKQGVNQGQADTSLGLSRSTVMIGRPVITESTDDLPVESKLGR